MAAFFMSAFIAARDKSYIECFSHGDAVPARKNNDFSAHSAALRD